MQNDYLITQKPWKALVLFSLPIIDAQNKPKPAPRLILDNDEECAEWEAGKRRKELRKQMRKEGF